MPSGKYDHNKELTKEEQRLFNGFVHNNVSNKKRKLSYKQVVYRQLAKKTLRKYQLIACEQGVIHPEEVS